VCGKKGCTFKRQGEGDPDNFNCTLPRNPGYKGDRMSWCGKEQRHKQRQERRQRKETASLLQGALKEHSKTIQHLGDEAGDEELPLRRILHARLAAYDNERRIRRTRGRGLRS
jgi:hypothetical protein